MKILFVAQYITIEGYKQFEKNRTGLGYIVYDIARNIAKYEIVELITLSAINKEFIYNSIKLIRHQWLDILLNFRLSSLILLINFLKKYPVSNKRKINISYYFLNQGYLKKIIQRGSYDLVHIHGCNSLSYYTIKLCQNFQIPFLITLHGLNSYSDSVLLSDSEKKYEHDFLKMAANDQIPINFIGNGNLIAAEKFVEMKCSNFYLINNGCNVKQRQITENIRKKYSIDEDDFVFVYVGNISKNKNQIQACRAYNLFHDEIKKHVKILFVGGLHEGSDKVLNFIKNHQLEDSLIICGIVNKERVANYYQEANATMLLSVSEGFGLSIIEGFVYGLPNLTFYDLGAVNDVYDSEAMIVVEDRNDETLVEAMLQMIKRDWNKEKIKKHSQKFSLENMAEKYINLYHKIIETNHEPS